MIIVDVGFGIDTNSNDFQSMLQWQAHSVWKPSKIFPIRILESNSI